MKDTATVKITREQIEMLIDALQRKYEQRGDREAIRFASRLETLSRRLWPEKVNSEEKDLFHAIMDAVYGDK